MKSDQVSADRIISVIIPAYNAEDTIERAVKSVTGGEIVPEVIIIDDASTDATPEICDCLAENPGVRVFHFQNNRGVSAARNYGIRRASGAFIGFVDSDDWVEPDMYSALLEVLEETGAGLAACGVIQETEAGAFPETGDGSKTIIEGKGRYQTILYNDGVRGYLCNKLFRREFISEMLDETVFQSEDLLFTAAYLDHIDKVVYLNRPLYHYTRKSGGEPEITKAVTLLDVQERLYCMYLKKVPEYAPLVEKNLLKASVHFRARIKDERVRDEAIISKVKGRIRDHLFHVLSSGDMPLTEKANLVVTLLFPRTALRLKRRLLSIRHRKGIWES